MANFLRIVNKIGDILLLNALFIVTTIGTVGIGLGVSISSLYACLFDLNSDNTGYYFRNYFKHFKNNFKTATCYTLVLYLICIFSYLNFKIISTLNTELLRQVMSILLLVLILQFSIFFANIFMVIAKFDSSGFDLIKFTFTLSYGKIFHSILIVLLWIIAIYMLFIFPSSIFFIFSSIVFIHVLFIKRILRRYSI